MDVTVTKVAPVQRTTLSRFTTSSSWVLTDMAVDSSRVAVSGYNYNTRTTFIDLFALNDFLTTPSINLNQHLFSKEFPGDSIWPPLCVSLFDGDSSHIVTVCGSQIDLINIHSNVSDDHRTVTYPGVAGCVAVSERTIYIGLLRSNKVIVFDDELNIIKLITLNGLGDEWPEDITVNNNNLFISTGHGRALRYNMDGELLNEYNAPDQYGSYALSITVSNESGLVFVLWRRFPRPVVVVYSLSEGHKLFSFNVDDDYPPRRTRTLNANRLITATMKGELRVYNTLTLQNKRFPFNFESLKEILSDVLSSNDCRQLGNFFQLSREQVHAIISSQAPVEDLFNTLEERGIVYPASISQLLDALHQLKLSDKAVICADLYNKYKGEETPYERFLAALSSHLTLSLPGKFCDYFKFTNWKRDKVTLSRSPGLTFLTVLDEMGIIHQFDVNALIVPLREHELVQAVAKVEAYQSLVEENKQMKKTPLSTLEEKRMLFIECLKNKIKSWYETTAPIPWKKSCKWTSSELFVASGLILTSINAELKVGNIDPDCKLQYRDIFTHDRLKSETRIIIEGDPGSGKTALLSQLAYEWSIGKARDANIVIFLPLMFVGDMTIPEAIEKFYVPNDVPLNADDIENLLNQANDESKACILLDGLEVYSGRTTDGEPSEVVRVMKKKKLLNCRVVLTSRSDIVQDLSDCLRLRLRQFGEDERDLYIVNLFHDNQEKQDTVKNTITNSAFLQDLCSSPLLFVFLVHNVERFVQYQSSGQQERVGAFMKILVDTFLSQAKLDDDSGESQSEVQLAKLSKIAFNGLCKGHRQLLWQKSFLYRILSNIKDWTESGILVAEEFWMVGREQQLNYQPEKKRDISTISTVGKGKAVFDIPLWTKTQIQRMSKLDREKRLISGTSEREIHDLRHSEEDLLAEKEREFILSRQSGPVGKEKQHEGKQQLRKERWLTSETIERKMYDVSSSDEEPFEEYQISPFFRRIESKTLAPSQIRHKVTTISHLHNVSLLMKFLHPVIQEWFAAIHFSSMIKHSKDKHHYGEFLKSHLSLINPADLHYILRFISYLCPDSCHLIMEHLLSVYKQEDGAVPEYILNCIFLCFGEVDSSAREEDMKNAVRLLCRSTVTIQGDDSRLLQQSKISMLTYASNSKIDIEHLKLVNVVVEARESVIIFNSNLTLASLQHLRVIEVSRWDQKLQKKDYTNLIIFLSKFQSLKEAHLNFPNLPPEITGRQLLSSMQEKLTVEWNIGKNVRYTLNKETGTWKLEFRRPASLSETSDKLATQLMVNENGGVVSIPDTDVELEIPPGALGEGILIRMRIIPHHSQEDKPLSFGTNSSVVVELLPSKLKLLKPTKLTLPHCLVLKRGVTWTAKVYSSHHEEGKPPQWEEEKSTYSELKPKTCVVWLRNFSWKKFEVVDGEIIEAKEILLYAARRMSSTETTVYVDVGYCLDLPKALEHTMSTEEKILLHRHPALFYKDGRLPLTILFEEIKPETWKLEHVEKKMVIAFNDCAILKTDFCEFVFEKIKTKGNGDCKCHFKAGQEGNMKKLVFPLQKCEASAAACSSTGTTRTDSQTKKKKKKKKAKNSGSSTSSQVPTSSQAPTSKQSEGASVAGSSIESPKTETLPPQTADESSASSKVPKLDLPVDDETLRELCVEISQKWKEVGRNLGFKDGELDQMQMDNQNNIKEAIHSMLKSWKQRNGKAATFRVLGAALDKANRKDLHDLVYERGFRVSSKAP